MAWPGPHQGRGRHPHPVPPHDRHRADHPRSHGHRSAGDGQRHRAEADRRREHGLHLGQGERQRALHAHDAVFRDVRQPRHLPRRLDRRHDAAGAAVADGPGQDARGAQRLQVGALQHRRGLLGVQRPRGQECRTSCARCRSSSWWRRRSTTCSRWTTRSLSALIAPRPSATAGRERLHLLRRDVRPARERCARHPRPGPTPSPPRWRFRKGGGRRNDRHRGRPLRRLRPLPAQGQAGVPLQLARPGAVPLGRPGGA